MANLKELEKPRRKRYAGVYCGICRGIRSQCSQLCRLALSYDMAFLSLLLMSLYEPEETVGSHACVIHPGRSWTDNPYIRYGADMNVALAYYNALDDYEDEGKTASKLLCKVFGKELGRIREAYPRQCGAIEEGIRQLRKLEKENCPNPDEPAGCFGRLMAELFVYEEDLWSADLREAGSALGRFIYLADAAVDYKKDLRKKKYNPYIAMNTGADWPRWEEYLILALGRCTAFYEKLPLVQDKSLLDNILYSGVWTNFGKKRKEADDAS
jgi:hypothetical protein